MKKLFAFLASAILAFSPTLSFAQGPSSASIVAGEKVAQNYAYGFGNVNGANIVQGNSATGTATVEVCPAVRALGDGRVINLFATNAPVYFDYGTTSQESVTPSAVSLVSPPQGQQGDQQCAMLTGSFTYTHGNSQYQNQVRSGSFGLQEAINDARGAAGAVTLGPDWGGTNAMITAAAVFPNVSVVDKRTGVSRFWNPTATGVAVAAPTLPAINIAGQAACDATHQMCSDATVAGSASWGGTVFACWAYVDILGNEGPCSATTSWTSVASKAIDLGIPAASPGAVGAVPYLSLSGGTYILAYQIPVTSTVCTMTTLETITPACAVANTTYNQAGSTYGAGGLFTTGGAQITSYPVSTAMLYPDVATTAQTITGQHPLTNSSITYSYAPGNRVGSCDFSSSNIVQYAAASSISGSSATTVPQPVGTWTIPSGCFNYIGAEFRVSGKFTYTDGGSGTSTKVIVSWDANGTNTASVPTPLCSILDTFTSVAGADNVVYSCVVKVLTTGTAGTVLANGLSTGSIAAGQTTLVRSAVDNAVAASAAINLATNARISVQFQATGATSNPGAQPLAGTLEVMN